MLSALDVHYQEDHAFAACVLFGHWRAEEPLEVSVVRVDGVAPYVPGAFYQRELPPLLAVLETLESLPEIILIDGYVWLGPEEPGLGAHLHQALDRRAPVIGIAKNPYSGATSAVEVLRGESHRPLWVTAVGIGPAEAAREVEAMAGCFRLPDHCRRADAAAREGSASPRVPDRHR